jgi:hypothetical protein
MAQFTPLPGEVTLEELMELARYLRAHPDNRRGADKTWVLDGIRSVQAFFREPRTRNDPPTWDPPRTSARTDPAT